MHILTFGLQIKLGVILSGTVVVVFLNLGWDLHRLLANRDYTTHRLCIPFKKKKLIE